VPDSLAVPVLRSLPQVALVETKAGLGAWDMGSKRAGETLCLGVREDNLVSLHPVLHFVPSGHSTNVALGGISV
jgi:hypothetical protein